MTLRRLGRPQRPRFFSLRVVFLIPFLYLATFLLHRNNEAVSNGVSTGRKILASNDSTSPVDSEFEECIPPAIDDFPDDFFTQEQRLKGGVVLHFLITAYVCAALAIVCDDYFVPSLEVISDHFGIPSDVAGATFMAIGTSAPELFSSLIGSFITEGDIGIGTIVGSAVFNILAVTSVAGFVVWTDDVSVDWFPISRDCIVYAVTVSTLVAIIYDNTVIWWEALILVILYIGYIVLMYVNAYVERMSLEKAEKVKAWWSFKKGKPVIPEIDHHYYPDEATPLLGNSHVPSETTLIEDGPEMQQRERSHSEESHLSKISLHSSQGPQSRRESHIIAEDVKHMESEVESSLWSMPSKGCFRQFWWILMWPVSFLFSITIPDCQKPSLRKLFLITFLMSVVWIAGLTYIGVWMVTIIGYTLNIPDTVAGITLLAAGTSIPEIISSVIVVRNGLGNMAICNLIGSNVFDILICLGAPWLIKTAFFSENQSLVINSSAMTYTTITLLTTVAIMFITFILSSWKLNRNVGITCLVLYLVFITLACMYELNVFGDFNPPPCPR